MSAVFLRVATALTLAFIYLPLFVIGLYAFNESITQGWPISGYTLDWFGEAWRDDSVREALALSVKAALAATAVALVLGTLASLAVARYRFFGRESISFLLILPIALPGIVTGMALNSTFVRFGFDFGLATIVIGHATFCVVVIYNNVIARLRRTTSSLEEASSDLGADAWQTFRYVTFPQLRTALLAGGLLAFALSFRSTRSAPRPSPHPTASPSSTASTGRVPISLRWRRQASTSTRSPPTWSAPASSSSPTPTRRCSKRSPASASA